MKDVDCRVFEDQLDSLIGGTLPAEGIDQLQLHAEECPDCSMLLRVKEHLSLPSLKELEATVPEELLGSILPRVERELEAAQAPPGEAAEGMFPKWGESGRARDRGVGRRVGDKQPWRTWLLPALSAAAAVLLFSTGFFYSELRRVQATGSQLAEEVGTLRAEMAALEVRTEEVERTAELAGRDLYQAQALDFFTSGPESLTLGDLIDLLESFSEDDVLLGASQARTLPRTTTFMPRAAGEIREILKVLRREIRDRGAPRDIRAGELADWLANSGIPRDQPLPTSGLINLLD